MLHFSLLSLTIHLLCFSETLRGIFVALAFLKKELYLKVILKSLNFCEKALIYYTKS